MKKWIWILVGIVVGIIVLVSVMPLFFETNPPVVAEPKWDSPQTRELAVRACFGCHSNETKWSLSSQLPGSSLIVVTDVLLARGELNFSNWHGPSGSGEDSIASEAARDIQRGSMPGPSYSKQHPEAVLSAAEKQQLIDGLTKSLAE